MRKFAITLDQKGYPYVHYLVEARDKYIAKSLICEAAPYLWARCDEILWEAGETADWKAAWSLGSVKVLREKNTPSGLE